jgi:heme/copper-type cytochrome/quinol oxidase subunit 2
LNALAYIHPVFPWERSDGSVSVVALVVSVLLFVLVIGATVYVVIKLIRKLFGR